MWYWSICVHSTDIRIIGVVRITVVSESTIVKSLRFLFLFCEIIVRKCEKSIEIHRLEIDLTTGELKRKVQGHVRRFTHTERNWIDIFPTRTLSENTYVRMWRLFLWQTEEYDNG